MNGIRTPRCPAALFVLVALFALAAACGGGGGAAVAPRPELAVVDQLPPPGATGVGIAAEVGVTFAADLDPDTVTVDSFAVLDASGELPGRVDYVAPTRTLVFRPRDGLPLGSTLTARVAASIRGVDGSALAGDLVWTFAAEVGQPRPAQPLTEASPGTPLFAQYVAGQAVVAHGQLVWELDELASGPVVQPSRVRGLHLSVTDELAVLCASGTVPGVPQLVRRRRTTGWEPPAPLVGFPDIAQVATLLGNARGDVATRLVGSFTSTNFEFVQRALWHEPMRHVPIGLGQSRLVREVALDETGGLWTDSPGTGVRLVRHGAAGSVTDVPMAPPGNELVAFRVDADGVIAAVYETEVAQGREVRLRRWTPAAGLEPEQVLFAPAKEIVQFTMCPRGDAAFAASAAGGALWTATMHGSDGRLTEPRETLTGLVPWLDGRIAYMATSPRGTTFLACTRLDAGTATNQLLVLRADAGEPFGAPLVVDARSVSSRFVTAALGADVNNRLLIAYTTRLAAEPFEAVQFVELR